MSLAPATTARRFLPIPLWWIGAALALAAAIGIADPTPENRLLLGGLVGAGVLVATAAAPLSGFLVLVASCIMMIVASVGTGERNITPFDVLLPPLIAGAAWTWLASDRRRAVAVPSEGRRELDHAAARFTRSVWLYVALAVGSLLITVAMGKSAGAFDSALKLGRSIEGMLMFGVGMTFVRDERSLRRVAGALSAGGLLLAGINVAALLLEPLTSDNTIRRAGMTWFANEHGWSIADPNEAGIALLLLWTVLVARQIHRAKTSGWVMMMLTLAMLVLSQSRSGLLAWLTFTALTWRYLPRRALAFGTVAAIVVGPFITTVWWVRMAKTLSGDRGSFEVYTTLVRVYGWFAAGRMFVDHPLTGVGYLGFRHFSDRYNDLGLILGTCENFFLETATGMGLVGLAVLGTIFWRMGALADVVARRAAPDSFGATLAKLHRPYLIAVAVSNLTCDNWIGMVGLAQTAVWCVLLLRAGQFAIAERDAS